MAVPLLIADVKRPAPRFADRQRDKPSPFLPPVDRRGWRRRVKARTADRSGGPFLYLRARPLAAVLRSRPSAIPTGQGAQDPVDSAPL